MSAISPPVLYGVFSRWPEDGMGWIHADDVQLVRRLIPSDRIFRRERFDGQYNLMRYGERSFRVRPALWQVVKTEGFDVGDWVEIRSLLGKNEPGLARILEMEWHDRAGEIRYVLERRMTRRPSPQRAAGFHVPEITVQRGRHYLAEDFQLVDHIPLEEQLTNSPE